MWHNWGKKLCTLVVATLLGLGAISWLVNPYGTAAHSLFPGLDPYKHFPVMQAVAKVALLMRENCERVFIGSSRTEFAYDPHHPKLRDMKNCNLGVSASFVQEQILMFELALKRVGIREIVWSFDFPAFHRRAAVRNEFIEHSRSRSLMRLVSWRMVVDSVNVLLRYLTEQKSGYSGDGFLFRPAFSAWPVTRFRNDRKLYSTHPTLYRRFELDVAAIGRIKELVAEATRLGIRVRTAVLPVHVTHLAFIRRRSLSHVYEHWITALVSAMRASGVSLVDFSTAEPPNDEIIPRADEPMRWFWDTGHMTAAYGRLVTAELFSGERSIGVEYPSPHDAEVQTRALFSRVAVWEQDHQRVLQRIEM